MSAAACGVAASSLLDDTFQHRDSECHAGSLYRLQVNRRQQPRLCAIAIVGRRVGKDFVERAEDLAFGGAQCGGGVWCLTEVTHRRKGAADINEVVTA
jgi:hypothetical protein